jgi:hypothetical protein
MEKNRKNWLNSCGHISLKLMNKQQWLNLRKPTAPGSESDGFFWPFTSLPELFPLQSKT